MEGWLLLHRKLGDSALWLEEPFTRGQAWVDLLMLAQHSPSHIRVQGMKINLKRGDVGESEVTLSLRWKWSRGKVRRFLEEIEKDGMVKKETSKIADRRKSVITICNYDSYQVFKKENGTGDGTGDGQATGRRRAGDGTRSTNDNECTNGKEINNLPDSANRAGAVDADAEIFYLSKKKKKLKAEVLESFNRFWKAFAYSHGKAEAADAWLSVYSPGMVEPAVNAAILEAQNRQEQIAKGKTPKWAQGWLTGRRWEDGSFGQTMGKTCKTCDYDHRPGYCDHKTPEQRKNCQSWTAVKA